jgi:iron complex outermembrane receptor protein
MKIWFAIILSTASLCAQQQNSVVVTGTAEPIPLAEADRDVTSVKVPEQQRPLYDSWFDLLSLDPALDLQMRAPGGFMGDLSIRGATFGQTLVLLNGMRLDDVQTGHFNLDLPIPMEMVSGMEVLKGSGSTLYGSDAIGGVVNVIAQPIDHNELRLLGGGGNFGFNEQHTVASFGHGWWQEELAGGRDFSTGFMPDRDYRNLSLSSLTQLKSRLGAGSILFAYSDKPYGADQFYGPYPSWERIKTWLLTAHQNLGDKTEASFGYRRHSDLFVLFRDDPQIYTNRHIEDSWQGGLRRHDNLPLHGVLSYGVEGLSESIHSTNLGVHSRTRGSGYVFYDVRSVRRYSLSAGIREEVYGAHSVATSPSLSGAVWLSQQIKLRASASRAFRLPSFTDLYYSDPGNLGNPNLKPESALSYEGGVDVYLKPNLHASATLFQRRDKNVIDYVAAPGGTVYVATNFDNLHFTGVETGLTYDARSTQHVSVMFSGLHGLNTSPDISLAKYAFNYPVQSGVIEWRGFVGKRVIGRTRIGVVERLQRDPYALWDASASYATGPVRPFLQLTNITSTVYQDLPGIAMPSRSVVGGCEFYLFGGR